MRRYGMPLGYLLAALSMGAVTPGQLHPSNHVEVAEAKAPGAKPQPAKSAQQMSSAAKLIKRAGHYSGAKAWRYSRGGWTVAEGKRRARKARNVARHKKASRGRS